jgi:glutamine amidotransferase
MNNKVTVVDYGSGNLLSMSRGLETAGGDVKVSSDPDVIANAERLVLPGVGAFGKVKELLHSNGMHDAVRNFISKGNPFLGVCVGMQMLMQSSEEFGDHKGFGIFNGRVIKIPTTSTNNKPHPVPHIGWSELIPTLCSWDNTILSGLNSANSVYFVHSFHANPDNQKDCIATCNYNGRTLTAAIMKDNVIGVQFHPEKSGALGISILHNFTRS